MLPTKEVCRKIQAGTEEYAELLPLFKKNENKGFCKSEKLKLKMYE